MVHYKLGFEIDCIHVSNREIDWFKSHLKDDFYYSLKTNEEVEQYINGISAVSIPSFNLKKQSKIDKATELLISKLSTETHADIAIKGEFHYDG